MYDITIEEFQDRIRCSEIKSELNMLHDEIQINTILINNFMNIQRTIKEVGTEDIVMQLINSNNQLGFKNDTSIENIFVKTGMWIIETIAALIKKIREYLRKFLEFCRILKKGYNVTTEIKLKTLPFSFDDKFKEHLIDIFIHNMNRAVMADRVLYAKIMINYMHQYSLKPENYEPQFNQPTLMAKDPNYTTHDITDYFNSPFMHMGNLKNKNIGITIIPNSQYKKRCTLKILAIKISDTKVPINNTVWDTLTENEIKNFRLEYTQLIDSIVKVGEQFVVLNKKAEEVKNNLAPVIAAKEARKEDTSSELIELVKQQRILNSVIVLTTLSAQLSSMLDQDLKMYDRMIYDITEQLITKEKE